MCLCVCVFVCLCVCVCVCVCVSVSILIIQKMQKCTSLCLLNFFSFLKFGTETREESRLIWSMGVSPYPIMVGNPAVPPKIVLVRQSVANIPIVSQSFRQRFYFDILCNIWGKRRGGVNILYSDMYQYYTAKFSQTHPPTHIVQYTIQQLLTRTPTPPYHTMTVWSDMVIYMVRPDINAHYFVIKLNYRHLRFLVVNFNIELRKARGRKGWKGEY